MTTLQTWTMTGIAAVALAIAALLATGALTSAQTDEPTATPSATEDAGDEDTGTGGEEDTGDTEDDADPSGDDAEGAEGDEQTEGRRGCGSGGKYLIKEAAAEVLGLSEEDLIAALMDGQTLAQIAEAQGMSVDDFSAALVTAVTADLQAKLDAGDITQEEFDEATADLDARIDEIINAEGGIRFHRRFNDGTEEGTEGTGTRFRAPFQAAPFGSGT